MEKFSTSHTIFYLHLNVIIFKNIFCEESSYSTGSIYIKMSSFSVSLKQIFYRTSYFVYIQIVFTTRSYYESKPLYTTYIFRISICASLKDHVNGKFDRKDDIRLEMGESHRTFEGFYKITKYLKNVASNNKAQSFIFRILYILLALHLKVKLFRFIK